MSDTGKQSPLGVNVVGALVQNMGLCLNPPTVDRVGSSTDYGTYTLGSMCNSTCLRLLTYAINDAYVRGQVDLNTTYKDLIKIGYNGSTPVCPALGNSKPPTFTWAGNANQHTSTSATAQELTWLPYTQTATTKYDPGITQWGYIRCQALQAWNEFNYNSALGQYKDFLSSWMAAYSFVEYSNNAILASDNSKTFLDGTYSNMNDLTSADVSGVSLALPAFGQDFIATGKAIDLATISTFGLPSNLLMTLQRYNGVTKSVSLALLATGMSVSELTEILGKVNSITTAQERLIYAAFNIIVGQDLIDVCTPLNCKTTGLTSLADLLNPQKLFPASYISLTVPVYNSAPGPTNSKTYYPIYDGTGVSSRLSVPNSAPTNILGAMNSVPNARNTFNIPTGAVLGALLVAGTSYNTFKNKNLGQILKGDEVGSAYPSIGAPIKTGSTTATRNGK